MPRKIRPREMIAVQPRRGGLVHITSLTTPRRTICGKSCDGWRVAPVSRVQRSEVSCEDCKGAFRVSQRPA